MRSTIAAGILSGLLVLTLYGLAGCATKPTQTGAIAIDATVGAAVAITVQRDTSDPAVWAKRARLITSVVETVRPLATGDAVSVPALAAAVGPLLDKANLKPAERIAANSLVTALVLVIDANTAPDSPQAVTVVMVLDSVSKAAAVYLNLDTVPPAASAACNGLPSCSPF